ncbi:MAG: hypothetical protein OXC03_00925 [Flavobacteriaceae bacterium]|nr:hypothetical protein [Flavobacteriaceae bacterium]
MNSDNRHLSALAKNCLRGFYLGSTVVFLAVPFLGRFLLILSSMIRGESRKSCHFSGKATSSVGLFFLIGLTLWIYSLLGWLFNLKNLFGEQDNNLDSAKYPTRYLLIDRLQTYLARIGVFPNTTASFLNRTIAPYGGILQTPNDLGNPAYSLQQTNNY